MKNTEDISGYVYSGASTSHAHAFLLPTARERLKAERARFNHQAPRLFDLGCGNGSAAAILAADGWEVTGVDPSIEGIAQAQKSYPELNLQQGSAYDDLSAEYGQFPAVISLEVVEHVYAPRDYARTLFQLVEPGGVAIVSTPYHGYLKNLALAATGKMDNHFTVLWDHGHIKFWSIATLSTLLMEAGFERPQFSRVGRIPPLARSMIAVARRPSISQ